MHRIGIIPFDTKDEAIALLDPGTLFLGDELLVEFLPRATAHVVDGDRPLWPTTATRRLAASAANDSRVLRHP